VVLENGDEVQAHILGVHIGTETIRDSLLCAGGDLNVELLCSQVAQNLCIGGGILHQRTTNDRNTDWLWLVVGDGQDSLGGMSVDELHTEDLSLWERGGDLDIVVGRLRRFYNLFDVFDLVELLVQLQHIDVMHQAADGKLTLTSAKALRAFSERRSSEDSFQATMMRMSDGDDG
jgi:hypothetical protein